MSRNFESALEAVADLVGSEPVAAIDLYHAYHFRCRLGTLSRWLATLFQRGVIDRRWDGNQRFGRYLYFREEG